MIAQVAGAVFGGPHSIGFFYVQATTALILVLAANTAFNGFPLLGAILARDKNLPGQLNNRGDRLAYSNGIIVLALVAGGADLRIYKADVTRLIQLYIIGVFTSFTLGQSGMVRHWNRICSTERDPNERRRIHALARDQRLRREPVRRRARDRDRHEVHQGRVPGADRDADPLRDHARDQQALPRGCARNWSPTTPGWCCRRATTSSSSCRRCTSRRCARSPSRKATRPDTLTALTVNVRGRAPARCMAEWERHDLPVPLTVLESPYREVTRPIIDYIK